MFPNRGSAMASPADDLIENDPARLRAGLVRLTLLAVLGGAATGLVATAFRIVLTEGAAAAAALRAAADGQGIGLAGYGLAEGDFGDLVLVPARTLAEAVALTPQKRTVIRRGRILVRDGTPAEDLPRIA